MLYACRLRRPLNSLQRWIAGDHKAKSTSLRWCSSPADVRNILDRFDWRKDGTRIGGIFFPLDFVSKATVTQARLYNKHAVDGDCDDAHHYAAMQLLRMVDVDEVYHVTIGYPGGGHLACVYSYRGNWWLMNYGTVTKLVDGLESVADVLMAWADHPGKKPRWLVFETVDFHRVYPDQIQRERWEADTVKEGK